MADEKSIAKTFMPPETWLADGDARPDYDYSTKSHMTVCLSCIACGPEVVFSPVVLQDIDSIGRHIVGTARGRWIPSQTKQTLRKDWGVWLQLQCLDVVPFLCFGLPLGRSSVNIYSWMDEHNFFARLSSPCLIQDGRQGERGGSRVHCWIGKISWRGVHILDSFHLFITCHHHHSYHGLPLWWNCA